MLSCVQAGPAAPRRIQLPRNSTRLQIPDVYVKIIGAVRPQQAFGVTAFDPWNRKVYKPGQVLDAGELPRPCVAIECTGPVGPWQRGKKREQAYILWRFDFERWEWVELCRAQSLGPEWSAIFREPAIRALHPRPELVDVIGRSHDLVDELLHVVEEKLMPERQDVRRVVLETLYERVAGRIADCA